MTGTISKIPMNRQTGEYQPFCFIKADNGKEYFLHTSNFMENWQLLIDMCEQKVTVKVEFQANDIAAKGPRADNCWIVMQEKDK
jgi:cold shock CspA family protein